MKKNHIWVMALLFAACGITSKNKTDNKTMTNFEKGTYGFDKTFLSKHIDVVELSEGDAKVLLVPAYQGRVMTSACNGDKGFSFGWINHDLIKKGEVQEHINVFGGEERFWLGPEGGQYSIYFKPKTDFVFENWFVPKEIDTVPFEMVASDKKSAKFQKDMHLVNYSATEFDLKVEREVALLNNKEIAAHVGAELTDVKAVAYESKNRITNTGQNDWTKENGLLSVWMLGMFTPSPEVTVVIPVKDGDEKELGPKVNDDYFGKIAADRLKVEGNTVFFKCDGKSRGKLGIPPLRATSFIGSWDAQNKVLTLLECHLPEGETDYVNSAWELQEKPFAGDALNSYNDGPLEDGSQMGPFYELESSSPAAKLKVGEHLDHVQVTYHFKGDLEKLDAIAQKTLGVSIKEIEEIF
ncbi:hypothetical protein EMN47_16305 [Prolixibacteraceae bacterium JC049]|nr:hypothetical protein [Prolixibacteraceae bacterium JC049]